MIINPNVEAVKGQILWSDKNKNIDKKTGHYIVYLGPYHDKMFFIGAMITHSHNLGNIPMSLEHFIKPDIINGYTVEYDNSYVIKNQLLKLMDWAPFKPVGMLSEKGIEFLEFNIGNTQPVFFPKNESI